MIFHATHAPHAHDAHDFESEAACAEMVANIRRGLIVAAAIVAVVAITLPGAFRPPRLAAAPAIARPVSTEVQAVSPQVREPAFVPDARDAGERVGDAPAHSNATQVTNEIR